MMSALEKNSPQTEKVPTVQPFKTTETSGITSHGHMTHQEKYIIFRESGDEDLLTLSPIYCDVIARVIITGKLSDLYQYVIARFICTIRV